ncbi:hypothetical protein BKA59DRAFT_484232 [Fusarium tricinctum]|uniref:Uncharacterized protein n=1 Tax=Fusarium tricinctum TaxID=61284 RepID=A0A8K0RS79_9HYPO|nr:hypothetical protein BKA59DRAFT_484232 [Fusarium tricinctum]
MQPEHYSQPFSNAAQSPTTGLKSTAKLHEASSKAAAAKAPEDAFHLPDPEYRHVAGHVSRRTDNTAPVAPPPRSFRQTQTPLPAKRLNRDRGRARKLGQNDGEDSGSDSDNDRKRVRSESPDNAKRPRRTVKEPLRSSLADSEIRTKEEPGLKSIKHHWTEIDQRRKSNAFRGYDKKTNLLRRSPELEPLNDDQRFQYSEKFREIKTWDNKFNAEIYGDAYAEVMGYRFIQRRSFLNRLLSRTVISSPLETITRDIEAEVIWRLNFFTPAMEYGQRNPDATFYLTNTVKTLYLFLSYCMPRDHNGIESVIDSAAQLMQNISEDSTTKNFIDTMVDAYMSKIIRAFAETFWSSLQHGGPINARYNYDTASYKLLRHISLSRQDGRIKDEYISWITAGNEQTDLILHKVESYEPMGTIRREFIMNPLKPGVVSLIEPDMLNPRIVRDISTTELSSLGWFLDDSGLFYWRYKWHMRYNLHTSRDEFGIFKVSMDDEVLEAWRPVHRPR